MSTSSNSESAGTSAPASQSNCTPPGIIIHAPSSPRFDDHPQPLVKFGLTLSEAFKDDKLPEPLVAMLVHIAQDGVMTTDVFRKGGNYAQIKDVMKNLMEGKAINFHQYSFHTLAAVVKRFLLKIPGGVFGPDVEAKLLDVLSLDNRMMQYDTIHSIITSLRPVTQQLVALLFGMWFRIVNHAESNHMSSEAVAKSVAPSLFHTCAQKKELIEKASQVLQILIDDFGVANMFGRKNIQYFANVTQSGINVLEKFHHEYQYAADDSVPSITDADYYNRRKRSDAADSQASGTSLCNHNLSSSPPSPQSLQQHYADSDPNYNPHKKLTHVSSLSAPEVNQGCESPGPELNSAKRLYLSISSLSRSDRVKHRQLLRMKKRSDWFLSANKASHPRADSETMLGGSQQLSVGKSSLEATSLDALTSGTASSSVHVTDAGDAMQLSSNYNSSWNDSYVASSEPLLKVRSRQDVINANHGSMASTSTPIKSSPILLPSPVARGRRQLASPWQEITEKEVRSFMVENCYSNQDGKPS